MLVPKRLNHELDEYIEEKPIKHTEKFEFKIDKNATEIYAKELRQFMKDRDVGDKSNAKERRREKRRIERTKK